MSEPKRWMSMEEFLAAAALMRVHRREPTDNELEFVKEQLAAQCAMTEYNLKQFGFDSPLQGLVERLTKPSEN